MRGAKGHATRRWIASIVCLGVLAVLALGVTGCDKRLARMEENQIKLQAMVAANARQLATISSQIHVSNGEVQEGIQKLHLNDQDLATGISTVQNEQDALYQAVTSASDAIDRRMATLDANQRLLQEGVSEVAGVTQRTASDVTAVAREQVTLHQMVASGRRELGDGIAAMAANGDRIRTDIGQLQQADQRMVERIVSLAAGQDRIRSGLDGMDKLMHAVAGDVTGISQAQTALHRTIDEHKALFADKTAIVEQNQRNMQAALDGIASQTRTSTEGIAAVEARQTALQQTLGANHKIVTGQVAAVIENQQGLQSNLTGLHQKADIIVGNVGTVQAEQADLCDTLKANHEAVTSQVTKLSSEQQQLQCQVDVLLATAGQTALDVVASGDSIAATAGQTARDVKAVATRQETMQQALQSHNDGMGRQIAGLAASQQQMQNGLDAVTATAGQTALDVIAVTSQQDALRQEIQDHDKAVNSRMAGLTSGQDQIQSSLDIVTATSGQTALDTIALNEGQARLAQAVQADRQAVADRLAEIVQSQQQWAQRFDAAQANVQTIGANLSALEQHLTKLHGSLQPSLDGLTSQLGADGQGRTQFETKVNQDIQALVEAIAQLRQDQASLTDQMQQMQTRTQTQTKDLLTAIQQLRLPPAEVKVSDSGTKLESSVAEAAAK